MFEQETDMRVNDNAPFLRIRQWRREFVSGVHISTDVFFTVRQVLVLSAGVCEHAHAFFLCVSVRVCLCVCKLTEAVHRSCR